MSSMSRLNSSIGRKRDGSIACQAVARVLDFSLLHVASLKEVAVDGTVEDPGEDVHHDAEAVALVAAELVRAPGGGRRPGPNPDTGAGGRRARAASGPPSGIRFPPPRGAASLPDPA